MATDITHTDSAPIEAPIKSGTGFAYFFAAALVAGWGISIATFGVPGLFIPAVIATPIMFVMLIIISRG